MDTPGVEGLAADTTGASQLKEVLAGSVPMGRMGHPDEIAATALFLASDESTFVTGSELLVDGGINQV